MIPAHLMRSVAGGYDNESIAVAAIVGTFFFWVRSLRNPKVFASLSLVQDILILAVDKYLYFLFPFCRAGGLVPLLELATCTWLQHGERTLMFLT